MSKEKPHIKIDSLLARLLYEDIAFICGTLQGISAYIEMEGIEKIDAEALKRLLDQAHHRLKPVLREFAKQTLGHDLL